MRKIILSCLLSFGLILILKAQDVEKFMIEVSNDSILLGNYFEVTFTIENAKSHNFQAPDFKGFQIVGGPSRSSQTTIINGEMTQRMSWSFYLEPADIGNYFIEAASIETEEGILETAPLEILVVPNPDGVIQQPKQPQDSRRQEWNFFNDPFFKKSPEKEIKKPKKKRKIYRI